MGWFRRPHEAEPAHARALAEFADQVDRLQDGDLLFLRSAWEAQDRAQQEWAWAEVERAIERTRRDAEANALEDGLVRWSGASRPMSYYSMLGTTGTYLESDLRRQALPVLRDAGRAILVEDVLDAAALELLSGPWRQLSGSSAGDAEAGDTDADGVDAAEAGAEAGGRER
jgi:hypothetical protein